MIRGDIMYNLLIADDKDVFLRMICRMEYFKLNQDKFRIKYLARNGLEALEFLNTGEPDIVLTDIRMPLMNGIELLKKINKNKLCRCTILLSEYSDFSYAKEGIINGAFDYIVKPVDNYKLKETFDRAFEFMKSFVDKDNLFFNSIVRLAKDMVSDDDEVFLTKLNTVLAYIKQNSDSPSETLLIADDVLEKLNYQITSNFDYIADYIPLDKICALNHPSQNESEIIQMLRNKVFLLRDAMVKFKVDSSCCLVNEIWYDVIANIEDNCNLQNIAKKFYVNKKYLSSLFKKETGIRYVDFATYFKMERAKMLLSYSNLKVFNIAKILGFSDTEYFSRVFKKQTGSTPSSFNWDRYIENTNIT